MTIVERKRTPGRRKPAASLNFDVFPDAKPLIRSTSPPLTGVKPSSGRHFSDSHQPVPPLAPSNQPALSPPPTPVGTREGSGPEEVDRRPIAALLIDGSIAAVDGQQHRPVRIGILGGLVLWRCRCGQTFGAILDRKTSTSLWWIRTDGFRALDTAQDLIEALKTNCHHAARRAGIAAENAGKERCPQQSPCCSGA